ncbi:Xaa-Pro dipeptidase [Salinicola rhizosphaerae]|uniref:Xaa-Pro dipeptidase n=1 Tax=Salinicola rhizosphaerae TaxID=1443141 RepID=A0ABQ3DNJ2_9GAMM|nr:Xaa-Pro dipeptidase [Salinicola rhizosphaerae]GHB09270.1 Xaa-Pro dipeptidase [Salinicola rhizosphaerae]
MTATDALTGTDALGQRQRAHLERLQQRYADILATLGFDAVLIYSGHASHHYGDDQEASFAAYGHFMHWTGAANHQHDWLLIQPGRAPCWYYHAPADFWHLPTPAPNGVLAEAMALEPLRDVTTPRLPLPDGSRLAVIGNVGDATLPAGAVRNPPALITALDELRVRKDDYERECLHLANRHALAGHEAARLAFTEGASELDIQLAYLAASRQRELQVPYQNIVGIDRHAGTLHYQHYDPEPPTAPRSLLVDAGHRYRGYCADITRTWASRGADPLFSRLIQGVTDYQQRLIAALKPGIDYVAMHDEMHRELAELLVETKMVTSSAEAAVANGLTRAFCPHGLGHGLGLQVHDVGGRQRNAKGDALPAPIRDPALRFTRTLDAGMVVTIEPGLYIIPMLLAPFREGAARHTVDWNAVDRLESHGGIRIEDNVIITAAGHDNLTQGAPLPER